MVTLTILRRPKTTLTHSASAAHRHVELSPDLTDEGRSGVGTPAHSTLFAVAKDLGLGLWKRLEDLDDWMGGTPLTKRERQAGRDIHADNSRHLVM